jgi:hypothetical protein
MVAGSPDGARMERGRRRWVAAALLAAWGLALVVAGVWSAHYDPATVREQSDLTQGRQTLDRAVETVVSAAGPGVITEVLDYQVTTGCRVTLAREGAEVDRVIVLNTRAGHEPGLLDRLAERLPAEWQPRQYRAGSRLFADAGDFVSVVATVTGPGRLHVTVSTGCRPGSDPVLVTDPSPGRQ